MPVHKEKTKQVRKVDITIQEKQELDSQSTEDLHQRLAEAHGNIAEIILTKKSDPHLNELNQERKDIMGDYKERVDLASAKREYIIQVLKNRKAQS